MIKRYYVCQSDLRIIEVTHQPGTSPIITPENNLHETYKGALEALIKVHDEEIEMRLKSIEYLFISKNNYNSKLMEIHLKECAK